ncbi:MAG: ribonuclease P protein component [Candidatus Ryanbacteria bacterium]|nr:ribonuclease P protein component [Candidatus Ryanbacteria bacterium]
MLARRERLRSSRDIEIVIKRGRRHSTTPLMIWVLQKPKGPFRAAILCSKKVDKRAVVRNKIKRRIREAIRILSTRMPTIDLVVSAKLPIKDITTSDIKNLFYNVFHIQ